MLVDAQHMEAHELYRMADDKAIVLVSTGVGCPIARAMTPALKALRDTHMLPRASRCSWSIWNLQAQPRRDRRRGQGIRHRHPDLMDSNQIVGESLGVTRTAEVFVVTPKTWKVAYHGPVNDAADYDGKKAAAFSFADIATSAVLKGELALPATQAFQGLPLVDFRGPR